MSVSLHTVGCYLEFFWNCADLLFLFVVDYLSSYSREVEWARNLKLGPMIGNDVHQLLLKYKPSLPDGGAVTKAWKCSAYLELLLISIMWKTVKLIERWKIDSINTKFGIRLQGTGRHISTINEPDWWKNMAATDQCIFAMGGVYEWLAITPTPFALSSQNLVGRLMTGLVICLQKHVELNL